MSRTPERNPDDAPSDRAPIAPVVVLGIDPGTRNLGYGAIVLGARGPKLYAAGVLRARDASVPRRLCALRQDLDALLARLKPTCVVVESAFVARSVASALRIGEGRGVALSCAAATGAEVVEIAPAVAKRVLVGNGAADKSQVARMVEHLLGEKARDLPVDATDALSLALAHAQRRGTPAALAAPRSARVDGVDLARRTSTREARAPLGRVTVRRTRFGP